MAKLATQTLTVRRRMLVARLAPRLRVTSCLAMRDEHLKRTFGNPPYWDEGAPLAVSQ